MRYRVVDYFLLLLIIFAIAAGVFIDITYHKQILFSEAERCFNLINKNAIEDSLYINDEILDYLRQSDYNHDFLLELKKHDSGNQVPTTRIVSFMGLNWRQAKQDSIRWSLFQKGQFLQQVNSQLLKVEFQGREFELDIQSEIVINLFSYFLPLFFPLFSIMVWIIASGSRVLINKTLVYFASMMFSISILIQAIDFWKLPLQWPDFPHYAQGIGLLVLVLPILLSIKGKLKIVALLSFLVMITFFIMRLDAPLILFAMLLPCLYIVTERGVKLNFYKRLANLVVLIPILILLVGIILNIPGFIWLTNIELLDRSFSFFGIRFEFWFFISLIFMLLLSSIFNLIYVLVFSRCLKSRIEFAETFTQVVFAIVIFLFVMPIFYNFGVFLLNQKAIIFLIIGFAAIMSILIAWKISQSLNMFNPVTFSKQKKSLNFLKQSFRFHELESYAEFTMDYLNEINPKYRIGFKSDTYSSGMEFSGLDDDRMNQLFVLLDSLEERYLNIDLEILKESEIGMQLRDYDRIDVPHLIFVIRSEKGKILALLMLGKMPGVYWSKALVEAIKEIVEIFESFYLSILYNIEVKERDVQLVEEQNARTYQEKLNQIIQTKNAELETEKKRIMDSIRYASVIQRSILPPQALMEKAFMDHMVIWKPRDIVGGDFYWIHQYSNELYFACVDCTGHGVPGALISIAASSALEQIVAEKKISNPGMILTNMHLTIGESLHQNTESAIQDGMDISIIRLKDGKLSFAGAKQSVLIYHPKLGTFSRARGNRFSVGGLRWKQKCHFDTVDLDLTQESIVYLYTDGITDQPTSDGRKLGNQGLQKLIASIAQKDLKQQQEFLQGYLDRILAINDQRDDITIIGLKL